MSYQLLRYVLVFVRSGCSWVFLRLSSPSLLHHPIARGPGRPSRCAVGGDPSYLMFCLCPSLRQLRVLRAEHQGWLFREGKPSCFCSFSSLPFLALSPVHTPSLLRKLGLGWRGWMGWFHQSPRSRKHLENRAAWPGLRQGLLWCYLCSGTHSDF